MNNNTDKTTIDISNESLQDARNRINPYSVFAESKADFCFDEGFESGTKWQKEKDKAIQDKLVYALRNIISMNGVGYKDAQKFSDDLQPLIEEAQELLNQLK